MFLAVKRRPPRIPGVFERGATQPAGMHRPSNAARLSPRAANVPTQTATAARGVWEDATRTDARTDGKTFWQGPSSVQIVPGDQPILRNRPPGHAPDDVV